MNSTEDRQKATRRRVVAGAGTAAAAVAAAAVIGGRGQTAPQATNANAPTSAKTASDAGGYRETDHVLRYYQTART